MGVVCNGLKEMNDFLKELIISHELKKGLWGIVFKLYEIHRMIGARNITNCIGNSQSFSYGLRTSWAMCELKCTAVV